MLFQTSFIAAVATLLTTSHSFVIPKSHPDGHFSVEIYANGTTSEPVRISDLVAHSDSTSTLAARNLPNPQIGCAGYGMDKSSGAYGNAYNSLNAWCDQGNRVAPNSAEYWVSGTAVAYICNYGGSNPCSSSEFHDANVLIDTDCNAANAGWVLINDWAKGYGRDNAGVPICSWGTVTK